MSRKKPPCPADRWEAEAMAWKAAAMVLARMCADRVGCSFDEERQCPDGMSCTSCWLNRAIRETAGKEASNG